MGRKDLVERLLCMHLTIPMPLSMPLSIPMTMTMTMAVTMTLVTLVTMVTMMRLRMVVTRVRAKCRLWRVSPSRWGIGGILMLIEMWRQDLNSMTGTLMVCIMSWVW